MIRKEIAQAAIDLAQEFDARGLYVAANPGSEVGKLIGLGTVNFATPVQYGITDEMMRRQYEPTAQEIEDESSLGLMDAEGKSYGSEHAMTLEEEVISLSEDIARHLAFAKGIVLPAVKEFGERLDKRVAALPQTVTFNPMIVAGGVPEPVYNQMLVDALKPYKNVKYSKIDVRPHAPEQSIEQIIELLKTGSASLDTDVEIWVNKVGSDLIKNVYDVAFSSKLDAIGNLSSLIENKQTGADSALAAFLLGRRLLDNPIEGSAVALNDWRIAIGDIVNQAGLRLCHALATAEQDNKIGLLITSYDTNRITVNPVVYDNFIASGGNDALIFGNILSDAPYLYASQILDHAQECLTVWESKNKMLTTAAANRRFVDVKSIIRSELIAQLSENLPVYYAQVQDGGSIVLDLNHPHVTQALKEVENIIDKLTIETVQDTWRVATQVIALGVFHYTDAFDILDGINRASALNPEITTAEAALISLIEYVADYLVSQLAVLRM